VDSDLKHGYVDTEPGVRLHYVEQGAGPLVVLLHGFPEFWFSWRRQLPALAAAGYRAVALDQRGYNLSSKPRGLEYYDVERLARDVAQTIEHLGQPQAAVEHLGQRQAASEHLGEQQAAVEHLGQRQAAVEHLGHPLAAVVGHDWGGGIAWAFAMRYPERLDKLAIINAPHPLTFVRHLKTLDQLTKSWYMFFFQLPWLPEAALRAGNFAALPRVLRAPEYLEALSRPGALTATINYYRALFRRGLPTLRAASRTPIQAPVLIIWGQRDPYLGPDLAEPPARLVPNRRLERLADVSHWPHLEQPERVNDLLTGFFKGG
jgi:pimeloyl-ACP methyl ester carboxylesterase